MRQIVDLWQVPGQIHAVVQQPQHFQDLIIRDPKHHEVTSFATVAGGVQGANARGQLIRSLDPSGAHAAMPLSQRF